MLQDNAGRSKQLLDQCTLVRGLGRCGLCISPLVCFSGLSERLSKYALPTQVIFEIPGVVDNTMLNSFELRPPGTAV